MSTRLPIVYIAGIYSGDNVIEILRNIREGIKLGERVFGTGYGAPFIPWLDWQLEMFGDHTTEDYYRYSLSFLHVADVMLVRREMSEASKGTQNEIALAKELRIPVYYDDEFDELIEILIIIHAGNPKVG